VSSLHKPAIGNRADAGEPLAAPEPSQQVPPYHRDTRPSSWRRLALATWKAPDNPTVYGTIEVDMTESLALIERLRQAEGLHVTVTHLVAKALALGLHDHPDGNGLIIGRRLYRREQVDIFCQVASEDGRDLSGVKLLSVDTLSLRQIADKLNSRVAQLRARKDREVEQSKATLAKIPDWLMAPAMRAVSYLLYDLGLDLRRFGIAYDQFGSAMVTSIGSIDAGLGLALAPLVPFSHVPIVVLVNNIQRRPAVVGDQILIRPMLTLGCTFDHRFIDGVTGARIAATLRRALAHPTERLV
jgi:pyruvate/2-oxoglutarate dehydrogenase complex dihydrolipoamide acyltransferase (E2) component